MKDLDAICLPLMAILGKFLFILFLFSPLFSTVGIKNMSYLISKSADKHINFMEKKYCEPLEVNIKELTRHYTISAIGATAFETFLNLLLALTNLFLIRSVRRQWTPRFLAC